MIGRTPARQQATQVEHGDISQSPPRAQTRTGHRQLPAGGSGPVEVAVTGDGRYAFVPEEDSADVAVFDLGGLLSGRGAADHRATARETGLIPVADTPAGIALSPDGSRMYVVSEGGSGTRHSTRGTLSAISVPEAERDPAKAVIGSVDAGCTPSGWRCRRREVAWVTDRGGNTVSAFRLTPRGGLPIGHLAAEVRVGSQPVSVTLIDSGRLAMVTDSARSTGPVTPQTIGVMGTARALAHHPALLGFLPAGAFPRQFGQAAGRAAPVHRLRQPGRPGDQHHGSDLAQKDFLIRPRW